MTLAEASIYLDYAATCPLDPLALDAMVDCYRRVGANPASQHRLGREARRILEDAAEAIGQQLGASVAEAGPDRVLFTSGGTEANNLALRGWHRGKRPPGKLGNKLTTGSGQEPTGPVGRLIVSAIEHPSTLAAAAEMERLGWQVDSLRVNAAGRIDLDHLDELLCSELPAPQLVSVIWGNNETGVLQPVEAVVARCRPRGIAVHVDAVQIAGKLPISFRDLGASTMTVAAHKFHGPVGIGVLLVHAQCRLQPILFGGSQQLGMRPGTESVALAVGMETALRARMQNIAAGERAALERRRNRLQAVLMEQAGAIINGSTEPGDRVPQTLNVSFPGLDRQAVLMALDFAGVCCSSGAACASGSSEPSHVLRAMGLPPERVGSAIRLSVGVPTTDDEIELAAGRIVAAVTRLRAGISSGNSHGLARTEGKKRV